MLGGLAFHLVVVMNEGKRKKENMAVMTSVGRDEMGASALRRCLNARMDSSNDLISASMACRWYSRKRTI
jgi:hypothetical protein